LFSNEGASRAFSDPILMMLGLGSFGAAVIIFLLVKRRGKKSWKKTCGKLQAIDLVEEFTILALSSYSGVR